ncbi:hypothetical protein GCM10009641_18820 [Mycobacterium cookii]|uniref:Uncharacterized protein n=1 Tax=Mycobacterium cookii TaxID=1775 RepID=A0A7I7L0T7_9MYCO|nr:hypothetical protein [Mycobacterium cookii]MCV7332959.1 hypothetical protein [Mycobacterium cookii]BBX47684.1 hypothetical protein MCOO_36990 [Mycobacterium cookii]
MTADTPSTEEKAAEVFALRLILDHLKMAGGAPRTDIVDEPNYETNHENAADVPDLELVFHELAITAAAAMIRGADSPEAGMERAIREIEDMLAKVLDSD